MRIKIVLWILLLGCTSAKAQDPIFTQYFMVPETLNAGFTGFLETTNIGVLHRTQWPDLNLRIDTDYVFANTWVEKMNSGFGVSGLSHRETASGYSFTEVNATYAYRVTLNDEWYFRPSIEVGFGNKSYGFQNLLLQDQINIGTGVINPGSIDPVTLQEKITFFDFSAAMLVNKEDLWIGASLKHINKPNIAFEEAGNVPLDMFLSAAVGYEFPIADYFDNRFLGQDTKLLLTANFMKQGEFNRLDLGSGLIFNKVFFGVMGSTNPMKNNPEGHFLTSINAFGGLQYEHFKFGYSYDFNTTKIGKSGGIYELSVSYQFDLTVKCFGCPKYY